MTESAPEASVESKADSPTVPAAPPVSDRNARKPTDLLIVRIFLLTLGVLLAGYMYLGRGFAHVGIGPVYVGELVLALGLVATAVAAVRSRLQISRSWLAVLLIVFMVLGLIRTVPYISTYHIDALRDATLWGYGVFALMIFALLDRDWVLRLFRLYGYVAIAFLFWGPVAYYLFTHSTVTVPGTFIFNSSLIPNAPGTDIPILFFKSQDMAVQTAGAIAFLIVGTPPISRLRDFLWRFVAAVPASWMVYITGTVTRGGLVAVAACVGVLGVLSARTRNWIPMIAGAIFVAAMVAANVTVSVSLPAIGSGPTPTATPVTVPSGQTPSLTPSPTSTPSPTPVPSWAATRDATTTQWWDNILSIFTNSGNSQLEGTKQFRLAWYEAIIHYTINGKYFWDGKVFGVNLAKDDQVQGPPDGSLREVPNSHLAVLARMGVPGFLLWILLQLGFALFLLRALLAHRRGGDKELAAVAAWVLAFWTAMMVNTTFDPYLEGPQGGIWFWVLFGLGLVLIRLAPRRKAE